MNEHSRVIYLPIRAFGDFIITATVIKENFSERVPTLLPNYLTDLFRSIEGDKYFEVLDKVGYNNQPAFYELYKVKDIKNLKRLLKDIKIIHACLQNKDQYMLDYSSKRLFFLNSNLLWPSKDENIYEGKLKLFREKSIVNQSAAFKKVISPIMAVTPKILILPDSRLKAKAIQSEVIDKISAHFNEFEIDVGRFSQNKTLYTGSLFYSSFKELLNMIDCYDLIISAESLPYHLANYLGKPHFVIYSQTRHFKKTFMTPFMITNNSYSTFTGNNFGKIIYDLEKIICDGELRLR